MILAVFDEFGILLVTMCCYWLTQDNAGGTEPYAKTIAVCYATAAGFLSASALLREVEAVADWYPWFHVLGRLALGAALVLVSVRLHILRRYYVLVRKEDDPAKAG